MVFDCRITVGTSGASDFAFSISRFFIGLLHSALKFTFEKEENDELPFLDVLVEKSHEGFLTSVFRKPTFTRQYFRGDSFGPTKRKTNLIEALVHRALMICLKGKLQHELENISSILWNNGYPESIIQITMSKKIALFNRKPKRRTAKVFSLLEAPLDWQNFFES